jgi:hypothetical protein
MEFIFMLTRDDSTVPDALEVYQGIRGTPLHLVGFKDVGASPETLHRLTDVMHDDGRQVFLEVVSTSREAELQSIEVALEIGVDYLLGGTHYDDALAAIEGSSVRYCPFPGKIVGHPSRLMGTIDEITEHARELTSRPGVDGLDLLAYRHTEVDPAVLTKAVVAASASPVIAAGSVDSEGRIRALADAGAWAFTIGGAIFEGRLPGAPSLSSQIEWTLEVSARS